VEEPVNFDNIRSITDGDTAIEAVLLASFLEAAQEYSRKLHEAFDGRDDERWRQHAHALKGASLNLGALPLAHLCGKAQVGWQDSVAAKEDLLQLIEAECSRVQNAINLRMMAQAS
jgi:HPt (histidine-containing phosphotransfer) domain-containing protein